MQKCEIEVICADAVERGRNGTRTQWNADTVERAHTKSLDANDKLIQTRSHVRDTIASRKRQVIMRKGKSTEKSVWIVSRELTRKKNTVHEQAQNTEDTENGKNCTISEAKSVCSS